MIHAPPNQVIDAEALADLTAKTLASDSVFIAKVLEKVTPEILRNHEVRLVPIVGPDGKTYYRWAIVEPKDNSD